MSESADEQAGEGEVTPEAAEETLKVLAVTVRGVFGVPVSESKVHPATTVFCAASGPPRARQSNRARNDRVYIRGPWVDITVRGSRAGRAR